MSLALTAFLRILGLPAWVGIGSGLILGSGLALTAFLRVWVWVGLALSGSLATSLLCASILMPHQNILLDDFVGVPDK